MSRFDVKVVVAAVAALIAGFRHSVRVPAD